MPFARLRALSGSTTLTTLSASKRLAAVSKEASTRCPAHEPAIIALIWLDQPGFARICLDLP
jgi:hypothetical protein